MKTYQQFLPEVLLHVRVQGGGICHEELLRRVPEQQSRGPVPAGTPPHTAGLEQHVLLVKP